MKNCTRHLIVDRNTYILKIQNVNEISTCWLPRATWESNSTGANPYKTIGKHYMFKENHDLFQEVLPELAWSSPRAPRELPRGSLGAQWSTPDGTQSLPGAPRAASADGIITPACFVGTTLCHTSAQSR